jgi:FKBP-type peptidyl-prolyl cis-trans isomerase SlyD
MSENKQTVQPGKYVEFVYDVYGLNADGTEDHAFHGSTEDPERIIYGVTRGVIEPLEKAILGLGVGDEFDVVVNADDAFGHRDEEHVMPLDKELFFVEMEEGKEPVFDSERIYVGAVVPMMTADGYRLTGIVKDITNDKVVVDFNHPMADKDVRFKGHITEVHDATPEELDIERGCGCGCDHDECGGHDHGSCGCGDGCCH